MERHYELWLHQPTGWASSKWFKSHHSPVLAFTSCAFAVTAAIASAEREIKQSTNTKNLPSNFSTWLCSHHTPLSGNSRCDALTILTGYTNHLLHCRPWQCHSKRLAACLPATKDIPRQFSRDFWDLQNAQSNLELFLLLAWSCAGCPSVPKEKDMLPACC